MRKADPGKPEETKKGTYVEWKAGAVMKIGGGYGFRVTLTYADETKKTVQRSGYKTVREANAARDVAVGELYAGTYVIKKGVRVGAFLKTWLEGVKRRGNYNTYNTYRTSVEKHIIPKIGKRPLSSVDAHLLRALYEGSPSYQVARMVRTVLKTALNDAVSQNLLAENPASNVPLPKNGTWKKREEAGEKTLSGEQLLSLILAAKDGPIYMQILFNTMLGLRRSEINALKYGDVNYAQRTLEIKRQLGRMADEGSGRVSCKREIPPKSACAYRTIPLPDAVFEAILKQRAVYEENREKKPGFYDGGYICCSEKGIPRSKSFHWSHYRALLKNLGLPNVTWHHLRTSYCTLLLKNDFSPKAVSKLMGHSKEILTVDVYGDKKALAGERIPALDTYIRDLMKTDEEEERDAPEEIAEKLNAYIRTLTEKTRTRE